MCSAVTRAQHRGKQCIIYHPFRRTHQKFVFLRWICSVILWRVLDVTFLKSKHAVNSLIVVRSSTERPQLLIERGKAVVQRTQMNQYDYDIPSKTSLWTLPIRFRIIVTTYIEYFYLRKSCLRILFRRTGRRLWSTYLYVTPFPPSSVLFSSFPKVSLKIPLVINRLLTTQGTSDLSCLHSDLALHSAWIPIISAWSLSRFHVTFTCIRSLFGRITFPFPRLILITTFV